MKPITMEEAIRIVKQKNPGMYHGMVVEKVNRLFEISHDINSPVSKIDLHTIT